MTAPVALTLFAVALALLGPGAIRRSSWARRSPRLGIAAWQALSTSLVLAAVLAGVALAVPAISWTGDPAAIVRACLMALREDYSTPGGALVSGSGALSAVAIFVRVSYCLARELLQAARSRRRQWNALLRVGRRHAEHEALVVDHGMAAAYCLPGRGAPIVVTSAALAALDEAQLRSVLAHEHAHQRGHHHLVLGVADALRRAFPWVSAFRDARAAMGPLVEMLADDAAARRSSRLTVATALVRLSEQTSTPPMALGAGGESALLRVQRLVVPHRPLGPARTLLMVLATSLLLGAPLALAIAPASAAIAMPPCPPAFLEPA